jgi:apolipoprotein N-acyltransferase
MHLKIIILSLLAGLLIPLGFAPIHMPGFMLIGLSLFFQILQQRNYKLCVLSGLCFGLGYFGLGVSWVLVSIHNYGHLNLIFAIFLTLIFVAYLALFPALLGLGYSVLSLKHQSSRTKTQLVNLLLFASLWALTEYLRSIVLGGFPCLNLGFGLIDTPLKYLLPITGLYGVSSMGCICGGLIYYGIIYTKDSTNYQKRSLWIISLIVVINAPYLFKYIHWQQDAGKPLNASIIQANLSMKDKWDEALFWKILNNYRQKIHELLPKTDLIVLPEAALPIPKQYLREILDIISIDAKQQKAAILLGIPEEDPLSNNHYYNTVQALGMSSGTYKKQQLVPLGEFVPRWLKTAFHYLKIPMSYTLPGEKSQKPIMIHHQPIATLICYELAYPKILARQLPQGKFIVSVSDAGWFGKSLAIAQQLQMAQTLSIMTAREQIFVNNSGLSALIAADGSIIKDLPAFQDGILQDQIHPYSGATFWVKYQDIVLYFYGAVVVLMVIVKGRKHRRQ